MPQAEHSQKKISGQRSGKMFQRVATDGMAEGENRFVKILKDFGEQIESDDPREIEGACVTRPRRENQYRNNDKWKRLNRGIETQVAGSAQFAEVPLECGRSTDQNKGSK